MKNENKTYQKVWYTAKAMLRGIFIATNAYMRKEGKSQIKKSKLPPSRSLKKKKTA